MQKGFSPFLTRAAAAVLLAVFAVWFAACDNLAGPVEWPSYTVVYHSNDGTGRTRTCTYSYGTSEYLNGTMFDREGHTIKGWAQTPDGAVVATNRAGVNRLVTRIGQTINLHAAWLPNGYKVVYLPNGGKGEMEPSGFVFGVPGNLGANVFENEPYAFHGWARSPASLEWEFADEAAVLNLTPENGGTVTLYALWGAQYVAVSFDPNGGAGSMGPLKLAPGSGAKLPDSGGMSKEGYTFVGWNTRADGTGKEFGRGETFTTNSITNVVLYAVWTDRSYTVAFSANGAEGTPPNPHAVRAGAGFTLPGAGGLSMHGHTFGGWNTAADSSGRNLAAGDWFVPGGSATLHAVWNPVGAVFVITFERNGGEGPLPSPNPRTVNAGETLTVPGPGGLSKPGHAFGGWNTEPDGTGESFDPGDPFTPAGDSTLSAIWNPSCDPGGCDLGEWTATTPATCTMPGMETRTCRRCGASETRPLPALGRDWGGWTTTTAPTCTVQGMETRACRRCGHSETRPLPAFGHDWGGWAVTTAPTPSMQGAERRTCRRCGTAETRPVPPLGHDCDADGHVFGGWETTAAPTCTTEGEETRTCTHAGCGQHETRALPALGHSLGNWTTTAAATCTMPGIETRTCTRANCAHHEPRLIPALGHHWNAWTTTTAPTCTVPGVETRICERCGTAETRPAYPLGHDWGEWIVTTSPTPSTPGSESRTCLRCGTAETRPVPPLGHDCGRDGHVFDNWTTTTAPTCTTEGEETRTCLHPGCSHNETRAIPELGHSLGNWTTTTAPTCTTEGEETRTCLHPGCSHGETRPIPETLRVWGEWTITTAPTPSTPGVETRTCADCGATETRAVPPLEPGGGTFAIDFAGFQNLAPIVAGPTFSLRDVAEGATPNIMVANPAGNVRWFHDGGRIAAGVFGQRGEILLLGPNIHGYRIGTHRVTVEAEIAGMWHGRVVTFTVTP